MPADIRDIQGVRDTRGEDERRPPIKVKMARESVPQFYARCERAGVARCCNVCGQVRRYSLRACPACGSYDHHQVQGDPPPNPIAPPTDSADPSNPNFQFKPAVVDDGTPLDILTTDQLRDRAAQLGIPIKQGWRKRDLIAVIQDSLGLAAPPPPVSPDHTPLDPEGVSVPRDESLTSSSPKPQEE